MQKKKAILSCLLFVFIIYQPSIFAAGKGYLRGFVTDSTSGEVISYATIVVKGTGKGASTDARGYYLIAGIPEGKQKVIVTCVGYKPKNFEVIINSEKITQLDIILIPTSIKLQEMSIIGERYDRENAADLGLDRITPKDIQMMPTGVESDIFRYLQTTSGVRSTGDVTSKYYVRGGGGDQNLVLLNGATVYNPFHALGIFSVIDPEMISILEFNKGGFPPIYGGRLSSVLNVVTKDGNRNNYHAAANASFLTGKASFEGPIPDGSFIVTARKSWYSKILKKYLNDKEAPFDFYDLSFKVNYGNPNIDKDSKIVAHGFLSRDEIKNDDPLKEDYIIRNVIGGINWHKVWSSPLFSVISLSYSGFDAEVLPNFSQAKPRTNKVVDITSNWDFTYMYPGGDEIAFGMQNKGLSTKLNVVNLFGQKTQFDKSGWDMNIYFNYKFYRFEQIGLDIGIRAKLLALTKYRPFLFEPRLNFTYRPNPTLALKAAIGRYSQEVATLSDENELISIFEPWVIIPDKNSSPETTHFIVGVKTYLSENFIMELEGYYKFITDLIDINQEKYSSRDADFTNVNGESYGLEYSVEYKDVNFYFKTNYALSWAYKIKNGVKYFPRYDSRHSLNIITGYSFAEGWQSNASWTLSSGMPFTPIAGFYDRLQINDVWAGNYLYGDYLPVTFWGERNSKRLPVYHRLDLSVTNKFRLFMADVTVGASITNVYNQKNIFYFNRDTGEKVYMLTFLPSLTLRVEL